ncbi:MAG: DUF3180 domain-containing protein [Candidatus Nanopelagicales bacterium]
MTPTRLRLLLLIAVVAGVLGWVLATIADSILERYLPVPWSAAVAMWLLAAGLGMWSLVVRPRLLRRPGTEPLPSFVAARTAALALAASRVGAGVFGFYVGVALVFIGDLPVPAAQTGAWASGATALGGAAIAAIALWLESLCRIKGDDDDESDGAGIDLRGMPGSAERSASWRKAPSGN